MLLPLLSNFAESDIATAPSPASSGLSLVVASGRASRFKGTTQTPVPAVIWNATDYANPSEDPNREIVSVTAQNTGTDTLTLGARGLEGTAAISNFVGGKTYRILQGITAGLVDQFHRAVRAASVTGISQSVDTSQATFTIPAGFLRVGDLIRVTEFWRKTASTTAWQRSTRIGAGLTTTVAMAAGDNGSKAVTSYYCEAASVARAVTEWTKPSSGQTYNSLHFNPTDDFTQALTIDWHANFTSAPAGGETLQFNAIVEIIRGL